MSQRSLMNDLSAIGDFFIGLGATNATNLGKANETCYETGPCHSDTAPRCGARTRAGKSCRRPPIRGRKRCRLHGGLSPGAPHGLKNGNFKNGDWTAEAIEERKWLRSLVRSFARTEASE
jgi:hypothetical protein